MAAVSFDLWHTLIHLAAPDEERYMRSQLAIGAEALARASRDPNAPEVDVGELRSAFEAEYLAAVGECHRGRTVSPAEQLLRAGARVGRYPSLERYLSELRHLVEEAPFRTAPGALDLLRSLSEEGYRLAVISNTVGEPGAFLRPVLRSMGFERYVESYTFSDELPWAKPSPEVFRKALGELETPPSETVHAGDGWSDIEGARRAHLRAGILYSGLPEYGARYQELFFPHGRTAPEAEYHASDLEEVGRLVRTILPRPRLSP